ncbi:MAG TPA: PAS domain S-box protein [Terriglobia bacterium]|nr:PAS domain S-box protein [Terriglobia bacterium]
MFRLLGLEPGSVTPTFQLFMGAVHSDDRERVILAAQKGRQERTSVNVEFRGIRPDGVVRHFQSRAEVMSDAAGNAVRMVGTTQDVTERKLAEESLRQRERDLEEAQRLAKVGNWAFELQSGQVTLSKEHFRILGLDPEGPAPTLEGMGRCYSPESWAQFQEAGRKCSETGQPFELEGELNLTDGTKRWVVSQGEIERDIHGNPVRFRGTTQDITIRKEVEEELRSSREMFYKAFHSSPEPICILTLAEGRFIDVNKAFTDQLGYAHGEVIGRTAYDLRLDPLAGLNEELSRSPQQDAWHDVEVELFTKTGEARSALISFETAEIGGVPCILAQGRDVTEHRRAEQALRASDERYRAFISQSHDAVWRVELEQPIPVDLPGDEAFELLFQYGYIAECNEGLARISGFASAEDLIGKRLKDVLPSTETKTADSWRYSLWKGWQTRTVELKDVIRGGVNKTLLRTEVPIVEDGKVRRIWGITRDITELTRAEEALRRSEASLAEAQRIALIGSWDWDILTEEGRWSDEMFRLVGAVPGSAHPTKDYFLSWVHPDDIESVNRAGDEALKDQQNYQYEFRVIRADGAVRMFQARAEIIRDAAGNAIRLVGASQDVTERKQAEAKLRVSEARYRTLIERAPEAIVVVDLDTLKFVDFNENAMHLFGLSREELLKVGPVEASPPFQPDGRPSSQAAADYLKQAIAGEIPVFDWVHCSAYGKDIPCEVRMVRLPASEGNLVRGSITDITERKRVEETLLKLKKAVDTSGEVVFMTDLEGVITSVNPEFTRLYGYTAQEVVGKATPRILKSSGTSTEEHAELWESVLDKRQYQGEIINRTKDGRLVNIETSVSPILGDRGEILGFLAIQRNISDRKRAEDELRASEERYRLLFERSLAGVVRTNREGRILECNEAFARIVGCASPEEVLSSNAKDFYFEDKERRNLFDQLDQRGRVVGVEMKARRKDGTQAHVLISASLIENEKEGQTLLATGFDITHWKELDEQLRQALKMEAVGRLAGGVAHDFNNMLQIINGYSELALDELTEKDPSRGHVQEIKNVVERAAGLTQQLLAFSRQQVLSPRILDLNASITNLSNMLRRLIGEDIELEIHAARDLGPVKADQGQIDQVLLNLVVNARDAMPRGGKLKIETSNVLLDSSYARGHFPMTPGNYVLMSVSDTGKGMDEQTQARIFEPFFTTKEIGKGTGLGLATVYGIVKQSGGYIWAQSEPGKGTTFNIYLPFAKESTVQPKVKAASAIDGETETILLVEDEEKVRGLVRRVLQARGYHVLEAPDGREALRVAEAYDGIIHLLLTDVVMPGMSGRQLAGRLEHLREGMKTLFMSGYTNEAIIHHGPSDPKSTILQKPFTMDVLSRTVRDVLKRS